MKKEPCSWTLRWEGLIQAGNRYNTRILLDAILLKEYYDYWYSKAQN